MTEIYLKKVENKSDAHDAGRELVLKIARQKLGNTPEIHYSESGKPYIDGLNFNISHSGEYVVCAFAHSAVGVDIEKISAIRHKVAKRFFHEKEKSAIADAEDEDLEFYKIWTMKEAYLKCLGLGITKDLDFNVFDIPNMHTRVFDGYVLSVCTKEKE